MTSTAHSPPAMDDKIEVPEWEHTNTSPQSGNASSTRKSAIATFKQKMDSTFPPHRKYLGMRRNILLVVVTVSILAIIVLILGLALGLTQHAKSRNLPLPSNARTFTGELTYYDTGLGACGVTSTASDSIVSVSHIIFDAAGSSSSAGGNSNANPLCGRMIRAERFDEERGERRSVDLKVVDRCTGCQQNDLDVSISAFEKVASSDQGRVDITWAWVS